MKKQKTESLHISFTTGVVVDSGVGIEDTPLLGQNRILSADVVLPAAIRTIPSKCLVVSKPTLLLRHSWSFL